MEVEEGVVVMSLEDSAFHLHLTVRKGAGTMIKTDMPVIHRKTPAITSNRDAEAGRRGVKVETAKAVTPQRNSKSGMVVGRVWTIICILVIMVTVGMEAVETRRLMCGK